MREFKPPSGKLKGLTAALDGLENTAQVDTARIVEKLWSSTWPISESFWSKQDWDRHRWEKFQYPLREMETMQRRIDGELWHKHRAAVEEKLMQDLGTLDDSNREALVTALLDMRDHFMNYSEAWTRVENILQDVIDHAAFVNLLERIESGELP